MASDLTPYLGNRILRWLGGNNMPSAPSNVYLALFDGNPLSAGTEVGADVRAATPREPITWSVPAAGTTITMASSADADFGASEGPCDITHVAVFDAASGGNMLAKKALSSPVSVILGTQVNFLAGDLVFNIGSAT